MADDDGAERVDGDEEVDLPEVWHGEATADHGRTGDDAEDKGTLELLQNLRDFVEESCVCDFLGRRTPIHFDAEHVTEQGLGDMERDTTEENGEERDPFEVGP